MKDNKIGITVEEAIEKLNDFAESMREYYVIPNQEPTHKEIMTKWWKISETWLRVICYEKGKYVIGDRRHYLFDQEKSFQWYSKSWFTGLESADIPPEQL